MVALGRCFLGVQRKVSKAPESFSGEPLGLPALYQGSYLTLPKEPIAWSGKVKAWSVSDSGLATSPLCCWESP